MSVLQPPPSGPVQDKNGRIYPTWDAWFRQVLYRSIAQTIPGSIPLSSATAPVADGAATPGASTEWARGDHRHPHDTTKMNSFVLTDYATVASLAAYATVSSLSAYAPKASPNFTVSISFGGTQILTSQQAGMGATLGAATLSGTYASDLATLQALYNKVLALETKLKTHGLIAT